MKNEHIQTSLPCLTGQAKEVAVLWLALSCASEGPINVASLPLTMGDVLAWDCGEAGAWATATDVVLDRGNTTEGPANVTFFEGIKDSGCMMIPTMRLVQMNGIDGAPQSIIRLTMWGSTSLRQIQNVMKSCCLVSFSGRKTQKGQKKLAVKKIINLISPQQECFRT